MATKRYTSNDNIPMKIFTGAVFSRSITLAEDDGSVLDATGYTMFCEIRDRPGGKLLATLSVDDTDIATGVFVASLAAADSLLVGERSGVYDVLLQQDNTHANVQRLFGGIVEFIPGPTEVT